MSGRAEALDTGLLAPVWAGTEVAALTTDHAWLQAMLDAEVALVRAQVRLGSVPEPAAAVIAEAASADRFDLVALAVAARASANPVVALVQQLTAEVARLDPAAADYVHRGSTSQDILDTGTMLVAARSLRVIVADLHRVAAAAAQLAERYRDTPMAGRTLAQHAVPVTFGLKAAGWLGAADRAATDLRRLLDGGLPVQLGGAAGTLAGYLEYAGAEEGSTADFDPGRYSEQLTEVFAQEAGLAVPVLPWHTDRAPVAELAWVLATATGGLGKIAVDVRGLSRTEVAEVAEPAADGRGGSSAMPHKRNPVLSTLIIAAATQIGPLAATLTQTLLAEDERPAGAWHAEWQPLRECLRLAGGAAHTAAELVEGLTADPERMRANLDLTAGLVISERVAAALSPLLGKAAAKKAVGRASAAAAGGRSFVAELAALPELAGRVDPAELNALMDPSGYLGASGPLVDRALAHHRKFSER